MICSRRSTLWLYMPEQSGADRDGRDDLRAVRSQPLIAKLLLS